MTNFIYCADSSYTEQEILQAEKYILKTLNWSLNFPCPLNFPRRTSKADDYNVQVRKYLLEIGCLEWRLLTAPSSLMAAASTMPGTFKYQSPSIMTPAPDDADAERMHKYITDRRIIDVRTPLNSLVSSHSSQLTLPLLPLLVLLWLANLLPSSLTSKTSTPAPPLSDVQYSPLIHPALIRHEIARTLTGAVSTSSRRILVCFCLLPSAYS